MEVEICHDCGAKEGQIHEYGCDMERCPFCGGQLIICHCKYVALGLDPHKLPREIYENGLYKEQENKWLEILTERGRVPYIRYPIICQKCGELWPEFFHVSDEEWRYYIQPNMRSEVICRKCYDWIKGRIDASCKV